MSQKDDCRRGSAETPSGKPVNALSEVANGDLHLFVTFETVAADRRTDGGEASNAGVLTSEGTRDQPATGDAPSGPEALADSPPFIDSVMRPGSSSGEFSETPFGEAVDVESLVSYLGLDFVEHQLFADRFRLDTDVVYTSRGVGSYQLLCVYLAGRGLLLVVDDDEAIRPLVGHARHLLTET